MKKYFLPLLGATAICLLPSAAFAQNTAETTPRAPDTSFTIGDEIVVTGEHAAVLTSVDRLGADIAQAANVDYAWELVGQMPGVLLTEFNQGAVSGKLSFRGFNGEGEVNAVKLLIDGVPSNSNDGNMPYIDMLVPLEIETVEVVRGTSDPRFGLHNIAGNVAFHTRLSGTYFDTRVSAGSFGEYDGQVAAGLQTGAFSQNYTFGYRAADGYRAHSDLERWGGSGRWHVGLGEDASLGLAWRHYEASAEEPGYLTSAVAYSTPRVTNAYNATDGDERVMDQMSVSFDADISDAFSFATLIYRNTLEDDRFVKFSAAAQQQRRYTDETHWGLANTFRVEPELPSGNRLSLEFGADYHEQENVSLRFLTVERAPTSQTRDQAFALSTAGVFGQAIYEPSDWLRITQAWRVDWVDGSFQNRLAGTRAPVNDYGAIHQPKLSIAWLPSEAATVYANWGRTFQIGVGAGAYLIPPRVDDLDPSTNEGWEVGARYAPDDAFELRAALWRQTATGEIKRKLNDPSGDFENIGATEREGVDLQASWEVSDRVSVWGALAWQRSRITTPDPATPALAGNEIDHIPEWMLSFGLDYRPIDALTLSLNGRAQTDYELATTNNRGRFGDFVLLNASASFDLTERVSLSAEVQNLSDEYYEYVWWDGAQTLHSPGEGRALIASLRARY